MISSRIRLARNIKGIPFTGRMTVEQKKAVCTKVKEVASAIPGYKFDYIDMENVTAIQAGSMVEEHLISVEFANNREGEGLLLDRKHNVSVMINEEDHLRIQVLGRGEKLATLYETASEIDDALDEKLHFAFSEKLGYLTHCPTNLGTGLRASVMMHLPALHESGLINKIINTVSQVGLTVRGMYGEGTKASASMYQVSNQITLGICEKNAIDNLKIITAQLIDKERKARNGLNKIKLEDMCFRALGTLQNSRILSSKEMMDLLSRIKLGISMGIIKTDVLPIKLFIEGQPNMLMKKYGQLEPEERDIYRSAFIRDALK